MTKLDLTNHILIAMPQITEAPFAQSVIYICQHNAQGAMGIIINHLAGIYLEEILQQLEIKCEQTKSAHMPVLVGGPVQPEYGLVLHSPIGSWQSSMIISDEFAVTLSKDVLTAIAQNNGPTQCLFALGHAEWKAGQLEKEILDNSWLFTLATRELLFDAPFNQRWRKAAQSLGIKNVFALSAQSGRA